MGCEAYCIICGGPDREPFDQVLAALGKQRGDLTWLDNHLGITSNGPLQLGDYEYSVNTLLSVTARECTLYDCFPCCHTACYEFLCARLGYKLQREDILPIYTMHTSRFDGHYWQRAKVHADYGGMVKYQRRVTAITHITSQFLCNALHICLCIPT